MRAYEIVAGSVGLEGLRRCERPDPEAQRRANPGAPAGGVVELSRSADGAGQVLRRRSETGGRAAVRRRRRGGRDRPGVTRFRVGDRVAGTFFRHWISAVHRPQPQVALGAPPIDGVLAEYAVFGEHDAVSVPAHLSFEAASTLPCAAVTAWHALMVIGHVQPGDTVLVLGTGGVSMFALQFARLAGARVLMTSSSDDKLARARALGAPAGVNYRDHS